MKIKIIIIKINTNFELVLKMNLTKKIKDFRDRNLR